MIKNQSTSDLKIRKDKRNSVTALIVFSISVFLFFSFIAFLVYLEASVVKYAFETVLFGCLSGVFATIFFVKKKYNLAKFILLIVPPYTLIIASILVKSVGLDNNIYAYLVPKFFAIVYLLGPVVFFGLRRIKYMVISFIILLPTVIFYDYLNRVNGIFIEELASNHNNYYLFVSVMLIFFGFALSIVLIHEKNSHSFKFKIDTQKEKIEKEYLKVKMLNSDLKYQSYLYHILNITSKTKKLVFILQEVLNELVSIDNLSIEQKGLIFISNMNNDLVIAAHKNIDPSLLMKKGAYFYNEALEHDGSILYDNKNDDSDKPKGTTTYSNYIIPIVHEGKVLGMIDIYIHKDQKRESKTEIFLETVANVLAKKILSDKTEEKLKLKNIELDFSKNEIQKTNLVLKQTYKELDESINYAEYMQKSLIPNKITLDKVFEESEVFFSPKDRVSGDFYFTHKVGCNLFFGVADCTGHGIPGSFLAAMATEAVRSVINGNRLEKPDVILDKLRDVAKERFSINQGDNRADSMDAAICMYDEKEETVYFSGGFLDMIIVRNNDELIEIKGTRCPVGSFPIEPKFELHQVKLQKGDVVYLSTDGFTDQFGSINGDSKSIKFKKKRFRELLLRISSLDARVQVEELESVLKKWRGNFEQIDDVTVFVVKHLGVKQ